MNKKTKEIITFVLIIAIFLLIAANGDLFFLRIDITENQIFTISDVSKNLYQDIADKVHITYYISNKFKAAAVFPTQIEDILYEYAAHSRGKIEVSLTDPIEDNQIQQADALGVIPRQMETAERGEMSLARIYNGIVVQYLDKHETIPFVSRIETLEYELTSKIRSLVLGSSKNIGILVGKKDLTYAEDLSYLSAELKRSFTVTEVQKGQDIPDNITVLFVIGNNDLDEFDIYPIDQFIMRGGKAFFAVEGVNVTIFQQQYIFGTKIEDSPLLEMLEHYGVRVNKQLVLDTTARSLPVQIGPGFYSYMDYPYFFYIYGDFVSASNPITSRFTGLDLYWASPLQLITSNNNTGEVIIRSTPKAGVVSDEFKLQLNEAAMAFALASQEPNQYDLAVCVNGTFNSYFAGRPIPTREGEERDWQDPVKQSSQTRLIVLGDADFTTTQYIELTKAGGNLELCSNSVEWLSNDEDILNIKTRQARDTRLNKIKDATEFGVAETMVKIINPWVIVFIVIVFGVVRYILRKRKKIRMK